MSDPNQIRSAQFVDSFFPVIDGVVQVVHNYTSIMNEQSYSCVVCPKSLGNFDDTTLGYDVIRTPSLRLPAWQYPFALPMENRAVKELRNRANIDIIHIHSPFNQKNIAFKLAKQLNIPTVTTFHTKYYDDALRITGSKIIARWVISVIIDFYNKCDSVWACSQGAAETLREYGYDGEITVMVNGTDFVKPEDTSGLAAKAADMFGIDTTKKNLFFVGTHVWQKNIKLILDTVKILCSERSDIRLNMVGTGYDEKDIKKYAQELGLSDAEILFMGKVEDHGMLSGALLNADLLFFPSVYDTSALVLQESSMLEVPALLVKGSNAASVVTPDINGFVAEESAEAMAKKINSVIDDAGLLKKIGENAEKTIPRPWRQLVPEVLEKYSEVIEKYKKGL